MTAEFTARWNRRNLAAWAEHLGHLRRGAVDFLEIGVFEAYTMCWVVERILTHSGSTAVGIDAWARIHERPRGDPDEIYRRAIENTAKYGDKVKLIRGESAVVLAQWRAETHEPRFDLIFVDGSHEPLDVLVDSCHAWSLLRLGGICVWDDYKGAVRQIIQKFRTLIETEQETVWESRRQLALKKVGKQE